MKREIKFRAWDGEEMQSDGQSKFWLSQGFDEVFPSEYQFMQYTGIKDKNGVEIYEGDIISESIYDIPAVYCGEEVFKVEFSWGGFNKISLGNSKIWERLGAYQGDTTLSNTKVVGNIYENPALL